MLEFLIYLVGACFFTGFFFKLLGGGEDCDDDIVGLALICGAIWPIALVISIGEAWASTIKEEFERQKNE